MSNGGNGYLRFLTEEQVTSLHKSTLMEQLVNVDEVFGMILKVVDTFEISEETMAVDVIHAVERQGNCLGERHTACYARRREQYRPNLSNRLKADEWFVQGSRDIVALARKRARAILSTHEVFPLETHVLAELDGILAEARQYCAVT